MLVMVTGGTGFIGSNVVDAFLGAGHAVSVLDKLSSGRRENLDPGATLFEMDLRDPGLAALLAGRSCSIFGSGDQARDFIHVADCARANLLLAGAAGGRATLNLGSGRLCTVKRLHAAMASVTGYDRPARFAPAREGEIHSLSLDPSRAAGLLGWRAELGLQEGLDQTLAWFRAQAPAPAPADALR